MAPFSPSASANSVKGIRQRRATKLLRHIGLPRFSDRALFTGRGFNGLPVRLLISALGKPQTMLRKVSPTVTRPG